MNSFQLYKCTNVQIQMYISSYIESEFNFVSLTGYGKVCIKVEAPFRQIMFVCSVTGGCALNMQFEMCQKKHKW